MERQIVSNQFLRSQPRWDFRYFEPKYLEALDALKNGKYPLKPLENYVTGIENFGAYSLCNLLEWVENGIPYVRVTDMKEDGIDWDNVPRIPQHVHELLPKSKVNSGDVLYSMAGTIGLAVVAPENLGECNSNQAIAKIRLGSKELNPYFLAAFLNSRLGRYQSERIANGQTVLNINLSEIGNLLIPIPPLEIQEQVVQVIKDAHENKKETIHNAEKIEIEISDLVLNNLGINWSTIEDTKRFKAPIQSFVNSRFDVRYRAPQANHALELLKKTGHDIQYLGNLIDTISYGASVSNSYAIEGIPFLRISNLKPNFIDTSNLVYFDETVRDKLGNSFLYTNELVMSRSGSVGIVAVVPEAVNGFAFGSFQIKFRLKENTVNEKFISYFLNSQLGQAQVEQQKTGSIQMNITIAGISAIRVPIPSAEIQAEIVRQADIKRIEAKNLRLKSKSLMIEAKEQSEIIILGLE